MRIPKGDTFSEEKLGLLPLTGQTRGQDIHSALMRFFRGPGKTINLKNLVSVTTDGAPSMIGKEKAVIALLRSDPEIPEFFSYHCILHQEQLCNKLRGGELKVTMDSATKTVNFIMAHALKHRQFRSLVEEFYDEYSDLAMHAEVRWLSPGKVLDRFMELLPAVRTFLKEKGRRDLLAHLVDDTFVCYTAFLTDILRHLNSLNLKLQGKQRILPTMMSDVAAFQAKLNLFSQQFEVGNFTHFPVLQSQVSRSGPVSFTPGPYCAYLTELKEEFSSCFADTKILEPVLAFTENRFACDVQVTSDCVTTIKFEVEKAMFEDQLIDVQHNNILKERYKKENIAACWLTYVPKKSYAALIMCAQKILTCFGSTYVCECSFSTTRAIKSKQRSRLTDRHLTDFLRAAKTEQQPDLKLLAKKCGLRDPIKIRKE